MKTPNTTYHNATVTRGRRNQLNDHKTVVIWFTGLSGSGKSTLAHSVLSIEPVGDYYRWLGVEIARTAMAHSFLAKIILFPSFFYYFSKKPTKLSVDTLCMGYYVVAEKV